MYNLSEWAMCPGTHAISYSDINKHLYIECLGGGILEWDTTSNAFITQVGLCGGVAVSVLVMHLKLGCHCLCCSGRTQQAACMLFLVKTGLLLQTRAETKHTSSSHRVGRSGIAANCSRLSD